MGNNQPKSQPAPQQRDPMDIQLDLRMTRKRLQNESNKCMKEYEKNVQKAKDCLKKNNEEGAKLFLTTAANKKQESTNLQKMACKIENIEMQVKSSQANALMIQQLNRVTPIMNQYTQQMPTEQLYANITQFDNALDDLMVQGKVMDQMMNNNSGDVQAQLQVDAMMQQMKQEEQLKLDELNPQNVGFQQMQQQQQQYNQPQQQQQKSQY